MKEYENRSNTDKMIAPNELRIGNLVDYMNTDREVVEIRENSVSTVYGGRYFVYKTEEIFGIPLTGQWLLDFGANKRDRHFIHDRFKLIRKDLQTRKELF